jgi:GNAT superfamily N-acetyltransferase
MAQADFQRELTRVYLENPCQVLPNPLWQTLAQLEMLETSFARDSMGINRLEAYKLDELHVYWRRQARQPSLMVNRRLEYQRFAIMHQDFLDAPTVAGFKSVESRYRLIYRPAKLTEQSLPTGFRFAGIVNSAGELAAVGAHIAEGESPALVQVQDWMERPVFAPDLWLWLLDDTRDQPAGLGVAELDLEIGEAAIEWIQILPDYQGRGLGRLLVRELLRRIADRAAFVTVSAQVDNRDNPGVFFRNCGFTGADIWWYLRR